MKCPVCNHENGNAHYCERCGTDLTQSPSSSTTPRDHESAAAVESEYTRWSSTQAAPSQSVPSRTPSAPTPHDQTYDNSGPNNQSSAGDSNQWNNVMQNEKVQQAKEVSKQYISYFVSVLARPYQTMKTVGDQHALNGLITMALIAILSSTYFLLTFSRLDKGGLFVAGFIRPLLFTAIILLVAVVLIYAVLKIEKITFRPKTLVAQYGTLLVPSVAALVLANLFIFISYPIAIFLLVVSYVIVFAGMNAVLFQHPLNRTKSAIDSMYTVLIANVVLLYILYRLLAGSILGILGMMLSPFGRL
ncbi:hypothetical protein [Paenibacillus sp. ACRRY]|uniref:hypothetical protein n=1 Tax=Paenibacillus sp. ACRRY TaxID=2918208 RepID=UPI001EF47758|nr:hypothetical protein [Paenibacillus sp. ACRRY]MCG7383898.1 hypothetical protein [Paenibacillus sp. ACRRY]